MDTSKSRPVSELERKVWLMGYFELGQTVEELAQEHGRHPVHVVYELKLATRDYSGWARYFIKRGVRKGERMGRAEICQG